ncbi:MAG: LPS export ABC transporter periplasmic protein LptC [Pseudomonadota bacterium]|nr:LPS export ABC transporter periplasmic protein LptC [Pseudomonadota bacterium]
MFSVNFKPSHFQIKTESSYSYFVSCMRILLPIIAIAIIAAIITWPKFQDNPKKFRMGNSNNLVTDNVSQDIVNPLYTGFDKNKKPFSITAKSASPKEGVPDQISLSNPTADFLTIDGGWVAVSSSEGMYHVGEKKLELNGVVNVFHDGGHQISTSRVKINFNNNTAFGTQNLEGQGPLGNIASKGFFIEGGKYFFKGPASVSITPNSAKK